MPLLTPSTSDRFLGIDVRRLRVHWRQAVDTLLRSRGLRWLNPVQYVRLQRADGRQQLWAVRGDSIAAVPRASGDAMPTDVFTALELPATRCLRRAIVLPALPPDELAAAVELDITSSSPFTADQLLWAYRARRAADATTQVEAVLSSRQQVESWLATERAGAPDTGAGPEVWAVGGFAEPIVLRGHGEPARERAAARARALHVGLIALTAVLLLAVLITPTLQLRARAAAAAAAYGGLDSRAAPVLAQRDQLSRQAEQLAALRKFVGGQAATSRVIEVLSAAIPDSAWFTSLNLSELHVGVTGHADNAADLMRTLDQIPGVHDVKATAPATRQPGSDKESFSISFELDPREFGALLPNPSQPS